MIMKTLKTIGKYFILLWIGGHIYYDIELIWRGWSHPAMILTGGLCFIACGVLNEFVSWETSFAKQCLIGGGLITLIEYAAGCVLNLWLKLGVWDYSHLPLNINGQICLPFFCFWVFLSGLAIVLDDYLRYWLFDDEKPVYRI